MISLPILSVITATPLVGAVVVAAVPSRYPDAIRRTALTFSLVAWAMSLALLAAYAFGASGFQYVEAHDWIPNFGIQYKVGIDGLSVLMLVLTTTLSWISILASFGPIKDRVKGYMISFLILEVGMIGVFIALDLFLFYIFWEIVLVPMYLIIGIWGGANRIYATMKFVLYTLVGSLLMLVAILATAFSYQAANSGSWAGAFDYQKLQAFAAAGSFGHSFQLIAFLALFLAFAIKVPMFPFHTWLPDAHVEAPTAGSVVLASVLLKMGTYGFIRFSLPLLPKASINATIVQVLAGLSIIGILYGALVSLMQQDWKKLVAYSSVSHLGFCTLGIFALNPNGLAGSVIQQINHGISTGMLFLVVGIMYERRHTRELKEYGGLGQVMPVYATVFAIAMFSSAGLPLLNGFIGEFTILQGAFEANRIWAALAVLGVIFGAAYLLWMYQRTVLGEVTNEKNRGLPDLSLRELATFLPLIAWAIWIGVYPKPFFDVLEKPVAQIVERVKPGYFAARQPSAVLTEPRPLGSGPR